ncbi:unnamed protein product, partial [Musa acuminata var. zebrina]
KDTSNLKGQQQPSSHYADDNLCQHLIGLFIFCHRQKLTCMTCYIHQIEMFCSFIRKGRGNSGNGKLKLAGGTQTENDDYF